jgi:alpha-soluble NSF attachment protein
MQAANAYKVEQRWNESGQAFERYASFKRQGGHRLTEREAACRQHGNEQNDAMNAFHNAAKSYKKTNPEGQYTIPYDRYDPLLIIQLLYRLYTRRLNY